MCECQAFGRFSITSADGCRSSAFVAKNFQLLFLKNVDYY